MVLVEVALVLNSLAILGMGVLFFVNRPAFWQIVRIIRDIERAA